MRWRSHRIDAKQNEREKKRLRLRHTNNVWMFCVCRLYRDEMKFMRKPMSHNHKTCVVLIFILCIGIDIWNVSAGFYQHRTARERAAKRTTTQWWNYCFVELGKTIIRISNRELVYMFVSVLFILFILLYALYSLWLVLWFLSFVFYSCIHIYLTKSY